MKKLITILMLVLCINSFAGTGVGNFSTPQVRRIVSNSVTIVRWTVTTISDLITIYNKSEDAIKHEKFEYKDILPTVVALANTSQWFPFAPDIRMVSSVLPNVWSYNVDKVNLSYDQAESDDPLSWLNEENK